MTPFTEKKIRVAVIGREIEIKPLTLKQTIMLGSMFGRIYEEIISKARDNNDNFIFKIISGALPDDADDIINILSNFSFEGLKNISEKISLEETAALARAVAEVNDFEAISANFKSAFGKMKI
ncbi:MAG: hypothetical protein LBI01_03145 [Elusimicrobium sp.]|jgi:hypothetical protein|nr:hypothetical protein [Elusimicrobium sp.]